MTIRPSTVGSYMLCPGRPGLRNEPGYNFIANDALLFGSGVHWVIEQEMTGNLYGPKDIDLALLDIFTKDQPDDSALVPLTSVTTRAKRNMLIMEIMVAVTAWKLEVLPVLPKSDPVIEERLAGIAGYTNKYQVTVAGTPDVVYPADRIMMDWKTAGRMWDKKKIQGQLQRVAYPWLASADSGWVIDQFVYWVYDRQAAWWGKFQADAGDVQAMNAFKEMAVTAAVNIEEGRLSYTPGGQAFHKIRGWHCSPKYCDAWKVCNGKFLISDGEAKAKALTTRERWN